MKLRDYFGKGETVEIIINPVEDLLVSAHDRAVVIAKENPGEISFIDKLVGSK